MKDILDRVTGINDSTVSWRLIDDQVIFLLKKDMVFYELNNSASFIWMNITRKQPLRAIIKAFSKKFRIGSQTAQRDVFDFINKLIKKEILVLK